MSSERLPTVPGIGDLSKCEIGIGNEDQCPQSRDILRNFGIEEFIIKDPKLGEFFEGFIVEKEVNGGTERRIDVGKVEELVRVMQEVAYEAMKEVTGQDEHYGAIGIRVSAYNEKKLGEVTVILPVNKEGAKSRWPEDPTEPPLSLEDYKKYALKKEEAARRLGTAVTLEDNSPKREIYEGNGVATYAGTTWPILISPKDADTNRIFPEKGVVIQAVYSGEKPLEDVGIASKALEKALGKIREGLLDGKEDHIVQVSV